MKGVAADARIRRLAPSSIRLSSDDKIVKPFPANVAAEVKHFRSEAIRQELASGESSGTTVDRVAAENLPAGMQVSRPAFPMDDVVDG